MEFSRQEDWSGLPLPTSGDLPDLGIKPASLASHSSGQKLYHPEMVFPAALSLPFLSLPQAPCLLVLCKVGCPLSAPSSLQLVFRASFWVQSPDPRLLSQGPLGLALTGGVSHS